MNTLTKILLTIAIASTVGAFLFAGSRSFGGAPSGLQATVATSTFAYPVGTAQTVLFATSTCAARVISTRNEAVMLSFNEPAGQVPTVTTGHSQLASTTVMYDAEQFGCGTVRVISATGGATAVSVSESR